MPTFYNWSIKRSGAGMRVYGNCAMGADQTVLIRGHKIGNIGHLAMEGGRLMARDRTTRAVVAILHVE